MSDVKTPETPPPPNPNWIGAFAMELAAAGAAQVKAGEALQNAARILTEAAATAT